MKKITINQKDEKIIQKLCEQFIYSEVLSKGECKDYTPFEEGELSNYIWRLFEDEFYQDEEMSAPCLELTNIMYKNGVELYDFCDYLSREVDNLLNDEKFIHKVDSLIDWQRSLFPNGFQWKIEK